MAVCRSCGQENPEIARFCFACAAPLTVRPPASQATRKTVTVVFVDVVGSTALGERLDAESLRTVIGRYFEEMSSVVERHGGKVEKFIGDAVMAVFGIPVVREDDALRAVRAAVEMRDALTPLNAELEREHGVSIQVRIGVNSGEVVAGDPVGEQRFATGDAVNVAARLEQAARPGEILVGESTHRLVRASVTAEPVEPLALKGKGKAVAAVRLLAVPGVVGRRLGSPIVGRDEELAFLARAFEGVVSEQACRLVTVLGSAGVGKSRLVEEFLHRRSDEATVLHGRCLSYGDGITFWPIRNVVTEAAGLTGDDSPQSARARIRSLVETAPDADLIVDRVADAVGVAESVPGQRGTSWAVGRLFEELARRRPLVVVFDDIHWGERTFLDLVEAIAAESRPAPILLLCMARPDLLELRPEWGEGTLNADRLPLSSLSDDASEQLVTNLLGASALTPGVRRRITAVTEGNPLFVEEVVAMLVDEGLTREGSETSLPPTIQALLGARLDRLVREDRAVLERGSVEGKVFHLGAVVQLSPPDEQPLVDERLSRLLEREFLQPGRAGFAGERAFRFRHQLLRDVAYESLPKAVRSELHERFAGWLDEKAANRAQEVDEILGHHLQQAYTYRADLGPVDERGRALAARAGNHLGTAGSRAYARGDAAGTRTLLARALTLLPKESGARVDIVRKLDNARFELGEYRQPRLTRTSLHCFWHRPLGHTWEMKESGGKPVLRCADCGKVTRGPRGWVDKRDDPDPARERIEFHAGAAGGGGSIGGGGD
jgi:class 3 adenylate cyclase